MNYEMMVKEAYEEILGFDKEADFKGAIKAIGDALTAREFRDALNNRKEELTGVTDKALKKQIGKANRGAMMYAAGKTGLAYGVPVAAAIGTGVALKKRHDKKKAQREAVEKAAAYYDEAQLVKEAAEADYAEACAYEDAALSILEELGYFED